MTTMFDVDEKSSLTAVLHMSRVQVHLILNWPTFWVSGCVCLQKKNFSVRTGRFSSRKIKSSYQTHIGCRAPRLVASHVRRYTRVEIENFYARRHSGDTGGVLRHGSIAVSLRSASCATEVTLVYRFDLIRSVMG